MEIARKKSLRRKETENKTKKMNLNLSKFILTNQLADETSFQKKNKP